MLFLTSRDRALPRTCKGLATLFLAWICVDKVKTHGDNGTMRSNWSRIYKPGTSSLLIGIIGATSTWPSSGVIALGDGANLVAAWAFQPGAAVTTEGRPSDLSALVLISPKPEGFGYVFGHLVTSLAPRVPLFLLAGDHDVPSKDAVQSVQQILQRTRLNKVELFPSSLHGYKLLRLEPKLTSAIFPFLETTLKNRPIEWAPEYNLTPVTISDPLMVLNTKPPDE